MNDEYHEVVKHLALPKADSHKGQNGRLLIIGGSKLFHAASIWSLTVASRIVDLVHYASVEENNTIIHELKKEFRNGIVISRHDIETYIKEDDVILIGPGMMRMENPKSQISMTNQTLNAVSSIKDIEKEEDEGVQTYLLTNYLLKKYPEKQWVIDAGALQMLDLKNIPPHAILTPHHQEFSTLVEKFQISNNTNTTNNSIDILVQDFAKKYNCIVLLKGQKDIASNGKETKLIEGGNVGMTKGGTGDVLAGLIAALACTNDPWQATLAGSYINKTAGDDLFASMGPFFNATDLANQIPLTMKRMIETYSN
jgi:NAD(P)H-hydrate epimerase